MYRIIVIMIVTAKTRINLLNKEKNIMLGPKLPAFISPNVLNVLVETFNIQPSSTVDEDLKKLSIGV